MADITITATSVLKSTGAITASGVAGATITAGQALYIDTSDANKLKLADANLSSLAATVAGIALNGGASGQTIVYQLGGVITIGATVVAGTIYVASATAGGIAPAADIAAGWRTSIIGVATSTSVIKLNIFNSDAVT